MINGKWFDESDDHAKKRIARELKKRNRPQLKDTNISNWQPGIPWSERWYNKSAD